LAKGATFGEIGASAYLLGWTHRRFIDHDRACDVCVSVHQ